MPLVPTAAPLVPTAVPFVPTAVPTTAPVASSYNVAPYIGHGDIANCGDFPSQAYAQAVLRADPSDPNKLDTDRDGIACESRPNPKDLVRVPR
ncbi:MAG: excalibur calcium-binding domain-containing protein [Chloroflexi bacterium]|nr:excalibur calcium-binding domain-containing protein [Chloroflexota bacterium]